MNIEKTKIILDDGTETEAQSPVIISASRSTDIPAFYGDWFVERYKKGYLKWFNPFNGVPLFISLKAARLIVFWTKNPKQFLHNLDFFDEQNVNYYFQFTLNDYEKEGLERKVPSLNKRIETFIELSEKIGKQKVMWRFDPLILTTKMGVQELLRKIENIGDKLKNYTEKLVFSFADISIYRKVEKNLTINNIDYIEFDSDRMNEVAKGLQILNSSWSFEIGTCSELIDLDEYGIVHNKCVDDDLIIRLFNHDSSLMKFLGVEFEEPSLFNPSRRILHKSNLKDRGQRKFCGCIYSKDIGQYNTCPHDCVYCYANASIELVKRNYKLHLGNPFANSIVGN